MRSGLRLMALVVPTHMSDIKTRLFHNEEMTHGIPMKIVGAVGNHSDDRKNSFDVNNFEPRITLVCARPKCVK
jgi:hypothetical protein